jgi:predicted dehydrogenase
VVKPFGWAYIGVGHIAYETANAIMVNGQHNIVAVWNRNHSKAVNFAKSFHAIAYENIEAAMTALGVEGVYIATTHDTHFEFASLALKLGKPVLCEKPLGINSQQAKALFLQAQKHKRYLVEAMWTWFNETARQVQTWLNEGRIGSIKRVSATYGYDFKNFDPQSRLLNPKNAGGALLDIGVYPIGYCRQLFGMPKQITCLSHVHHGVDTYNQVTLDYSSFLASLEISFEKNLIESFVIEGELGTIHIPNFHMAYEAYLDVHNKRHHYISPSYQPHLGIPQLWANQFNQVANEIRQGKKNSDFIDSTVTQDTLAIIDSCLNQNGIYYPIKSEI